LTNSTTIFKQD